MKSSTLINKKVLITINKDKTYNIYEAKKLKKIVNHLCLKNPTFRYIKKRERIEIRGTLIPFSYESNDLCLLCKNNSPVALEVH